MEQLPIRLRLGVILLIALAVYAGFASVAELVDRDEPRFARCAIEMSETGDWLVPRFRGEVRPDKPVFIYWAMAASEAVFGRTELAFRMPSILGSLLAACFTFLVARRLFDPQTGLLAATIYLGSITPFYIGTVATADGLMLGLMTACLWLLTLRIQGERAAWHLPLASVLLGVGLLIKGPVVLAVPVLGAIGMRWFARGTTVTLGPGTGRGIWIASAVGIAMFAAWGIPANTASNGILLEQGIGRHVLGRMVDAQEGHGGEGILGWLLSLPLYVPIIFAFLFPWSGFLAPALRRAGGSEQARVVLFGWALPTFLLMSLVVTKLPHYVLPTFPALAILIAHHLIRAEAPERPRFGVLTGLVWLIALAIAALFGGVGWLGGNALSLTSGALGIALALTTAWLTTRAHRGHGLARLPRRLALIAIGLGAVVNGLGPTIDHATKVSKEMATAIREQAPEDIQVFEFGYGEPSVDYYLDQTPGMALLPIRETAPDQKLATWLAQEGKAVLITPRERLDREELDPDAIPGVRVLTTARTFRTSKSWRWFELVVVARGF